MCCAEISQISEFLSENFLFFFGGKISIIFNRLVFVMIEMVQRRAIYRTINDYFPHSSVTKMQQELGWRSLDKRRADACNSCHSDALVFQAA